MLATQNSKRKTQNNNAKLKTSCFKLLVVFLSFTLYAFSFNKTDASGLSLRIHPPLIQIRLDPPANVSAPINIENLGDETLNIEIIFKPFTASEKENGEVAYFWDKEDFFSIGENPLIFDQVRLGESISLIENDKKVKQISLAPKQKKTLNLNINIPKDESTSDYYFSIIFISKNTIDAQLSHSQIQGGIASNILLSVGKEKPSGEILEFSTSFFTQSESVPFKIGLQNKGKHFITAKAEILIKNILGQTVDTIKIDNINVLAERNRFEKYIWENNPFPGPYSATLNITFDQNSPVLSKTINFFVFPIKLTIGLGVILITVLLIRKRFTSKLAK